MVLTPMFESATPGCNDTFRFPPARSIEGVEVKPSRDRLFCRLEGFAVIEVTGTVDVDWMSNTNAYICDAQSVKVYGEGEQVEKSPWLFLLDWQGKFRATGVRYQVQLGGGPAAFHVTGQGFARLRGKGYCTVNGTKYQLTDQFQEIGFG